MTSDKLQGVTQETMAIYRWPPPPLNKSHVHEENEGDRKRKKAVKKEES